MSVTASDEDNKDRSRRSRNGESDRRESRADRGRDSYDDTYYDDEDHVQERSSRRERRESRIDDDDDKKDRSRLRDKVAVTGLGIAAAGMGLAPPEKDQDREKSRDREARRKPSPSNGDDDYERRRDVEDNPPSSKPNGKGKDKERERVRDRNDDLDGSPARHSPRTQDEPSRTSRQVESESKPGVPAENLSASDSDRPKRRGSKRSAFNPNNTSDLRDLKQDLAALNLQEKEHQDAIASGPSRKGKEREAKSDDIPTIKEPSYKDDSRSEGKAYSPSQDHDDDDDDDNLADDSRGREVAIPGTPTRTVRVVSPPRDKSREKPLKSILKQPKVSFPEEVNPVREGVAPHKDDKKAKDVPAGAKWTKISRKVVNPEALEIGKERFEVRDDFVVVLRVLGKDEIQAYAAATQVLRGKLVSHSGILSVHK